MHQLPVGLQNIALSEKTTCAYSNSMAAGERAVPTYYLLHHKYVVILITRAASARLMTSQKHPQVCSIRQSLFRQSIGVKKYSEFVIRQIITWDSVHRLSTEVKKLEQYEMQRWCMLKAPIGSFGMTRHTAWTSCWWSKELLLGLDTAKVDMWQRVHQLPCRSYSYLKKWCISNAHKGH